MTMIIKSSYKKSESTTDDVSVNSCGILKPDLMSDQELLHTSVSSNSGEPDKVKT
jgi:hypothetical protein